MIAVEGKQEIFVTTLEDLEWRVQSQTAEKQYHRQPESISLASNTNNRNCEPTTAGEARVLHSAAYARNAEEKVTYLNQKLKEERRQWNLMQAAKTLNREPEAEERKPPRRHKLVLELLRQAKPVSEIEEFVRKFG
ncbi:hypothetical protein PF010_g11084 [Phytophthora fragariae]|uniref:Uncharacterized protein n=1 Tax=Phytophthora fragariae TaxID=53985 RepID=A0A6G0L704_9STRA|nr:hypothetical protein PF010_g11084 [Phytophthora fragariae]